MSKVTVLGAGLVAGPLVRHILEAKGGHTVTVAARNVERARTLVGGHPRGSVRALEVDDADSLASLVAESDVVVSMLPYIHHVAVGEQCIAHGRHLVTTSYVSPAMRALEGRALAAGVTLLNELGLDPGIDHMSAMKVIHGARARGGRVTSFRSYCGGLPAPEDNNNPFGYKFSWSPRGVVLAARNNARYLRDGEEVVIPGAKLFESPERVEIPGVGSFEGYPNRDSLAYIPQYGLEGVQSMFRGTLRNLGHCETWLAMSRAGLFDDAAKTYAPGTFRGLMASLCGVGARDDVESALAHKVFVSRDSAPMQKLTWLGMFEASVLPSESISPLDALVDRMVARMQYAPGERDMIVLRHDFVVEYPDSRERIQSTLIDYGTPEGASSMSRTVGLPAALGALAILDGTLATRGVVVPTSPLVYEPILAALEGLGVRFTETRTEMT